MKKLLLLTSLALCGMAASAETYSDYFKVYYEDQELTPGQTIYCYDLELPDEDSTTGSYQANVKLINQTNYEFVVYGQLDYANPENASDANFYGEPSLCYEYYYLNPITEEIEREGLCFGQKGVITLPLEYIPTTEESSNFVWQADLLHASNEATTTAILTIYACDGDEMTYELIEDTKFQVNIVYAPNEAGVSGINADSNEAPQYFNLQGVRVANPDKGIYLVKRGNMITKEVVR